MSTVRIDGLNPTLVPQRDHEFPAMRAGITVKLRLEQVLSLLQSGDIPSGAVDLSKLAADARDSANHTYDPTASGLTATDVQAAIDEVAAGGASSRLTAIRVYDVAGSPHTWTKPADLDYVIVEVWGGGGSGGGGFGSAGVGGGGSGGGYGKKRILAADLGSTETVTIGAGASAAATATNGNAGGTSSFGSQLSATGGQGGLQGDDGLQSNPGGTATGADIAIQGKRGGRSGATLGAHAGGGGDAPHGGFGEPPLLVTESATGGFAGNVPGAGGTGGRASGSSGPGASGRIVVYEFTES